jgi:uncharacterized protein (TIGR00251 family)
MAHWLSLQPDGAAILSLHVQPNARRSEFAGRHGDAIKLRLAAPPVDGKANEALCRFVAEYCGVPRAAVTLVGGQSARAKRVRVEGADARVKTLLEQLDCAPLHS